MISFFLCFIFFQTPQEVEFESSDQLAIQSDLYMAHEKTAPFIVLFHQAGFSRGEYLEIAPKLVKLGFNCMAVDQRSGNAANNVENLTAKRAKQKGLSSSYLDAQPDMLAAIQFVKEKYSSGKLLIWGSSYSAALVLVLAGQNPKLADGIIAFSPGEYFEKEGKPQDWVKTEAKAISAPVFITSAAKEKGYWWSIFESIPSEKQYFLPSGKGIHGSSALWKTTPEHPEYWSALEKFLGSFLDSASR